MDPSCSFFFNLTSENVKIKTSNKAYINNMLRIGTDNEL